MDPPVALFSSEKSDKASVLDERLSASFTLALSDFSDEKLRVALNFSFDKVPESP